MSAAQISSTAVAALAAYELGLLGGSMVPLGVSPAYVGYAAGAWAGYSTFNSGSIPGGAQMLSAAGAAAYGFMNPMASLGQLTPVAYGAAAYYAVPIALAKIALSG